MHGKGMAARRDRLNDTPGPASRNVGDSRGHALNTIRRVRFKGGLTYGLQQEPGFTVHHNGNGQD